MASDPNAALRKIPLSSPILENWFNGAFAAFTLFAVVQIGFRATPSRRNMVFLAIILTMFTAATVHSALAWWLLITAFTNFGATPAVVDALAHTAVWYKAVGATMFALNVLIADCVFIWRCWIFWDRKFWVVVVPILATIAGTVCAIISIIGQVEVTRTKDPGSVPRNFVNFSLPYFGLSLATALYTSIFICVRLGYEYLKASLFRFDRRRDRILYYLKAVFVVVPVESAAIYSINLLAFVILTAERNSKLSYPQNIHPQLAGIAVTLIFLRIVLGYSRTDYTQISTNGSGIQAQNGSGVLNGNGAHHNSSTTSTNNASDAQLIVP